MRAPRAIPYVHIIYVQHGKNFVVLISKTPFQVVTFAYISYFTITLLRDIRGMSGPRSEVAAQTGVQEFESSSGEACPHDGEGPAIGPHPPRTLRRRRGGPL